MIINLFLIYISLISHKDFNFHNFIKSYILYFRIRYISESVNNNFLKVNNIGSAHNNLRVFLFNFQWILSLQRLPKNEIKLQSFIICLLKQVQTLLKNIFNRLILLFIEHLFIFHFPRIAKFNFKYFSMHFVRLTY